MRNISAGRSNEAARLCHGKCRRGNVAAYVERIIKGAKPANLPIGQPKVFDLTINRFTAKALGIEIPTTLLAAADQVIDERMIRTDVGWTFTVET